MAAIACGAGVFQTPTDLPLYWRGPDGNCNFRVRLRCLRSVSAGGDPVQGLARLRAASQAYPPQAAQTRTEGTWVERAAAQREGTRRPVQEPLGKQRAS
eukprot:7011124-Pyramimonas_sp.AAC.1